MTTTVPTFTKLKTNPYWAKSRLLNGKNRSQVWFGSGGSK